MGLLHTIVAFVVALGVLIVVHEYGHYLAARLCRVKVLRFSVGFGRPLVSKRLGADRTEWVVAAVPFGGYVKMLDEREGDVAPEEAHRAFNRQSVARRILIVVAGPVFNFIFAILVYAGLFMYGLPEARPVIAAPPSGTLAAAAGLKAGQTVREVDGEAVQTWQDFRWRVLKAALERRSLRIETIDERGRIESAVLDLTSLGSDEVEGDVLGRVGVRFYQIEAVIGEIVQGSAAQRAGLAAGDRILRVDGAPVEGWQAFVQRVQKSPGKGLRLAVERRGAVTELEVTPDEVDSGGRKIGRIGAGARAAEGLFVRTSYGLVESFGKALYKTWDLSAFSLKMLGKMLVGEVSWKHLSGPVTIADFAGQSAQLGWISYLTFLALISVSLGVLNLLPVPLLDGGHLMYYLIEIIKGRPLSERAMELGQRVGLALLLGMMAFAFYNDLNRLLTG